MSIRIGLKSCLGTKTHDNGGGRITWRQILAWRQIRPEASVQRHHNHGLCHLCTALSQDLELHRKAPAVHSLIVAPVCPIYTMPTVGLALGTAVCSSW
jgi:hypothetical protein